MDIGTLIGLIVFAVLVLTGLFILTWSERKAKSLILADLRERNFTFLSMRKEKLKEEDPFDWTVDRKTDDYSDDRLALVEGATVRKVHFENQEGEAQEAWVRVRTYFIFPKDCQWKPRLESFGPSLYPK